MRLSPGDRVDRCAMAEPARATPARRRAAIVVALAAAPLLMGLPARADDEVWIDDCPFDANHPHLMRCFSRRRVTPAYAAARAQRPAVAPPDAGAGVDAGSVIGVCNGKAPMASSDTDGGLGAPDFVTLYGIPSTPTGAGKIVAVVDACSSSSVLGDLADYRARYGLPPLPECGGGPGHAPSPGGPACIGVVSETGDARLPPIDSAWTQEQAADIEMVSAACPACSILLVQADSPNTWDFGAAVNEAVALGADAVSNSYGAPEDPQDPFGTAFSDGPYVADYVHDGVLITASSGDQGYLDQGFYPKPILFAPNFPASIPSVLSVGGTTVRPGLPSAARGGYTEVVWSDFRDGFGGDELGADGSGCSIEFARPAYQASLAMGSCEMRGSVDVSAVASSTLGGIMARSGGVWNVVEGTSISAPLVAGLFARLGLAGKPNSVFYENAGAFFDVVSGNDVLAPDASAVCSDVMCTAGPGWDGPTGLGTPNAAALSLVAQGIPLDASAGTSAPDATSGCGCTAAGASPGPRRATWIWLAALGALLGRRRLQRVSASRAAPLACARRRT